MEELGSFAEFEATLCDGLLALGREVLAAQMSRYDVTASDIEVEGVHYRPNRCFQTHMTSCGPGRTERNARGRVEADRARL